MGKKINKHSRVFSRSRLSVSRARFFIPTVSASIGFSILKSTLASLDIEFGRSNENGFPLKGTEKKSYGGGGGDIHK